MLVKHKKRIYQIELKNVKERIFIKLRKQNKQTFLKRV